MFSALTRWLERRREIRARWQADARSLILNDERGAYYQAQRMAARSRVQGSMNEFIHWTKVAAEIARISPVAEMDVAVVQSIVDKELSRKV